MKISKFYILKSEWEQLYDLIKLAEENLYKDTNGTLVKLRQAIEFIVRQLFIYNSIDDEYTKYFERNIKTLKRKKMINIDLFDTLFDIKETGNDAVHNLYSELDEAKVILNQMFYISAWFKINYGKENCKLINFDYLPSEEKNTIYEYILKKDVESQNRDLSNETNESNKYIDTLAFDSLGELINNTLNNNEVYYSEYVKSVFEDDEDFRIRIENMDTIEIGIATIDINKFDSYSKIICFNGKIDKLDSINMPNIDGFYLKIQDKEIDKFSQNKCVLCSKLVVFDGLVYVDINRMFIKVNTELLLIKCILFNKTYTESLEGFKKRIEELDELSIGKIKLLWQKYNIKTLEFPVQLAFYNYTNSLSEADMKIRYLKIDKQAAKELFNHNTIYDIYSSFEVLDNVVVLKGCTIRNSKGEKIKLNKYIPLEYSLFSKLNLVKDGIGCGYKDYHGNIVLKPVYEEIVLAREYGIRAKYNSKIIYIHWSNCFIIDGELVLTSKNVFDYMSDFEDNSAVIKVDNKWGLIDSVGNFLLSPIYSQINRINSKYRYAILDNEVNIINKDNNIIQKYKFDSIDSVKDSTLNLTYGDKNIRINCLQNEIYKTEYIKETNSNIDYANINNDYKIKEANRSSHKVTIKDSNKDIQLRNAMPVVKGGFSNKVNIIKQSNKYGATNINGKIIVEPMYDSMFNMGTYYLLTRGRKHIRINNDGTIT